MKQGEAKPYFRFQLGNVYIAENILIMKNLTDSRKSCGNRCGSAPEVIQELHYLSAVLFWKNKKQLPEENNWTWVKRPVLISLAEDKNSPYLKYNSSLLFFSPFLLLFYKLFTVLFRGNEMIPSILFQLHDYSVFTFLRENHSFMVSTSFLKLNNWEATREARMLQAPIKGRKISA